MGMTAAGAGSLLTVVGLIWIVVIAIQSGDLLWGVVSIICGIVGLIYGLMHMDKAKTPVILMIMGIVLSGVGQLFGGFAVLGL